MTRTKLVLFAILCAGCKTKRLPPLPPERDPVSESATVAPWRAPPDVLNTELSKGAPDGGGHEHMHHGAAPAASDAPDPHAGHGKGDEQ